MHVTLQTKSSISWNNLKWKYLLGPNIASFYFILDFSTSLRSMYPANRESGCRGATFALDFRELPVLLNYDTILANLITYKILSNFDYLFAHINLKCCFCYHLQHANCSTCYSRHLYSSWPNLGIHDKKFNLIRYKKFYLIIGHKIYPLSSSIRQLLPFDQVLATTRSVESHNQTST